MPFLVQDRECGGKFDSFEHFIEEIDKKHLNKKVIENLIKSGAFDWTGKTRASLFESYSDIIKIVSSNKNNDNPMQLSLFSSEVTKQEVVYKNVKEWSPEVKAKYELEAIGFYTTSHL